MVVLAIQRAPFFLKGLFYSNSPDQRDSKGSQQGTLVHMGVDPPNHGPTDHIAILPRTTTASRRMVPGSV